MVFADGLGLVLRRDDGGVWRLDGPGALTQHVGRRVTIAGVRSGFDRLEVEAVDGRALRRLAIDIRDFGLGVLVVLLAITGIAATLLDHC